MGPNENEISRKLLELLKKGQTQFDPTEDGLKIRNGDRLAIVNLPSQLESEDLLLWHEAHRQKKKRHPGTGAASIVLEFKITGELNSREI